MEHRKNNKDGYKKIYPMSLSEDDTFCHYCGRKVSSELALHWDHVPALNVRIPEEYGIEFDIRKTLVRSCAECNILASDTPHLDYLERHIWLKAQYLRRYKSVLINANPNDKDELVSITGKKSSLGFQELLSMLGFGLKTEELINSPILKLKNKPSGRLVKYLIAEHLTGSPHEVDEEEAKEEYFYEPQNDEDIKKQQLTTTFLREFLLDEWLSGNKILSAEMLREWIQCHPGRAFGLDLRLEDVVLIEGVFDDIVNQVNKLYQSEIEEQVLSTQDEEINNEDIEPPKSKTPVAPRCTSSMDKKSSTKVQLTKDVVVSKTIAPDKPTFVNHKVKQSIKTETKNKAFLNKHRNDIIMAFMMAMEGKRYANSNMMRMMNEKEFLIFIKKSGLDRSSFHSFVKDKSFKAYNEHIPNNPESFYNLKGKIW